MITNSLKSRSSPPPEPFLPVSLLHDLPDTASEPLRQGTLLEIQGSVLRAKIPFARVGEWMEIERAGGDRLPCTVVGFDATGAKLLPLEHPDGLYAGAQVRSVGSSPTPLTHQTLERFKGCVVDALGNLLSPDKEGSGKRPNPFISSTHRAPPSALRRTRISERVPTGIKVIDGLTPIGKGQRMGIFAPAGVGKSTLLGALARNTDCDVVVAALIGERGREVREFIEEALGPEGLARSVVVFATSDEPPARRMLAASTATAIAESFRAQGKHVLLMVDSLTRVARAIREVSLCLGELPVRQGYTPSVFTELPRLLERAGTNEHGAITALYTILSSDENDTDVLREELVSLLDGHLCMTNQMVLRGIRPAIDPTRSLSRLSPALSSNDELSAQTSVRTAIARLWKEKEMLMFGGKPDESLEHLLRLEPTIHAFLTQTPDESVPLEQTRQQLGALASLIAKEPA